MHNIRLREFLPLYGVIFLGFFGYALTITLFIPMPTCTSFLSQQAEPQNQGQVLGNNQALLVLGESSSAAIGGAIAAIFIPLPIITMGVILLITGLLVRQKNF